MSTLVFSTWMAAAAASTARDGASETGPWATAFVAFVGAALVMIAQRQSGYAHA